VLAETRVPGFAAHDNSEELKTVFALAGNQPFRATHSRSKERENPVFSIPALIPRIFVK
jgi:hypothetical protein